MDRRLALVTGASAGIGAAFARILASHGYDVALTARRADRLDKLAEEISLRYGVEALTVTADLAEPEAPGQILDFLTAHGRTVDALVNNAGYGLPGAYADTRWEDQRAFIQVMMTAPAELAHRVLPGMIAAAVRPDRQRRLAGGPGPGRGRPHPLWRGRRPSWSVLPEPAPGDAGARGCMSARSAPASPIRSSTTSPARAPRSPSRRRPGCGWAPTRWPPPATRRWRPTAPICVPGAPNKAIAAVVKLIPDDWALALMASQSGRGSGEAS